MSFFIIFSEKGNFGNTSVFWDYVFGTLQPESIEHIETGRVFNIYIPLSLKIDNN